MGLQLAFSYPENQSPCFKKSVYNWAFQFHTYTEVEPSALARYSFLERLIKWEEKHTCFLAASLLTELSRTLEDTVSERSGTEAASFGAFDLFFFLPNFEL